VLLEVLEVMDQQFPEVAVLEALQMVLVVAQEFYLLLVEQVVITVLVMVEAVMVLVQEVVVLVEVRALYSCHGN
jgi:hypothetical protein